MHINKYIFSLLMYIIDPMQEIYSLYEIIVASQWSVVCFLLWLKRVVCSSILKIYWNHKKIKLTTLAWANLDRDCTLEPAVIQAVLWASAMRHHCWYNFQLLSVLMTEPSLADEHFQSRNAHTCALLSFYFEQRINIMVSFILLKQLVFVIVVTK